MRLAQLTLALTLTCASCLFRTSDPPSARGREGALWSVPPDPQALAATALSATRIRLRWQSGGGSTAGFRLAFRDDGVPPDNCDEAIGESEIFGTLHDVRGLSPATRYDFRLCAVNANTPPDASPGVMVSATTPAAPSLPTCDTTVPAGNHTMAAFQTVLDQAVAAGAGADGTVAVCLEDGVIVGAEGGPTIDLSADDVFILAHDGDEVRFSNPSQTIFRVTGRNGRLHNLALHPGGWGGSGVEVAGGSAARLSNLRIAIDTGSGAAISAYWGAQIGAIDGLEATVEGGDEAVAIVAGEGSTIASIADSRVTTYDNNVALLLDASTLGVLQSTVITTGGSGAHGIVLRNDAHVDAMSEVMLRRLGAFGAESHTYAIVCDAALGAGGNEFFVSSAVYDVTICSTFDVARWTGALADTADGTQFVEPTTHVGAAGGGRGCQTFPFDDGSGSSAGTDQRITLDGSCSGGPLGAEAVVATDLDFVGFQAVLNAVQVAGDRDGDSLLTVRIADGVIIRNTNLLAQQHIVLPGSNFYIYANPGDTATLLNERTNGTSDREHGVLYVEGMHNLSLVNLTLRSSGVEGRVLRTAPAAGGDRLSIVLLDRLVAATGGEHATAIVLQDTVVQRLSNSTVQTTGRYATPLQVGCGGRINIIEDARFSGAGDDLAGVAVECNSSVSLMRRVDIDTAGERSPGLVVYKDSVVSRLEGPARIRTFGERSHGLLIAGSSAVEAMDAIALARAAGATRAAVGILVSPEMGANNYFDSPNVVSVAVCGEGGAAWEAGGLLLADGIDAGPWTAPPAHLPHLPGPVFGAQTFPCAEPALTAQSIQLGGSCP